MVLLSLKCICLNSWGFRPFHLSSTCSFSHPSRWTSSDKLVFLSVLWMPQSNRAALLWTASRDVSWVWVRASHALLAYSSSLLISPTAGMQGIWLPYISAYEAEGAVSFSRNVGKMFMPSQFGVHCHSQALHIVRFRYMYPHVVKGKVSLGWRSFPAKWDVLTLSFCRIIKVYQMGRVKTP